MQLGNFCIPDVFLVDSLFAPPNLVGWDTPYVLQEFFPLVVSTGEVVLQNVRDVVKRALDQESLHVAHRYGCFLYLIGPYVLAIVSFSFV